MALLASSRSPAPKLPIGTRRTQARQDAVSTVLSRELSWCPTNGRGRFQIITFSAVTRVKLFHVLVSRHATPSEL